MTDSQNPALEAFVTALVDAGGLLSQIHAHMESYRSSGLSAQDAPTVTDVMRTLLTDVLARTFPDVNDDAIVSAADLVDRAAEAIAGEIYLVAQPPPRPLNRAQRRRGMCA